MDDQLRKILASPEGIAAVAREIRRQLAERQAAEVAETSRRREVVADAIAKALRPLAAKLAELRREVALIKEHDAYRRILDSVTSCYVQNGLAGHLIYRRVEQPRESLQ